MQLLTETPKQIETPEISRINNIVNVKLTDGNARVSFYNLDTNDVDTYWGDNIEYATTTENLSICISRHNYIPYITTSANTIFIQNETINEDEYQYIRPYKKTITPFTAEVSSAIFASAENNPIEYEQFYIYRAFFNKACEVDEHEKFKVILLPNNELGISWVATEEEHTDVLIGRFRPFDREYAMNQIEMLRKDNPSIGTEILRADDFANIPVRQPLGVLVADGYAAIGDSGFMTVPVIGSGIANSLKAAKILADAVSNDCTASYSAETLWTYQKNFYKEIGAALAPLACVKLLLTRLEGPELDYIFAKGILNAEDMTIDADSTSLGAMLGGMSMDDIKTKLNGLVNNKVILGKVVKMGLQLAKATAVTAAMPTSYNRKTILRWVEEYNSCFKH